MSIIMFLWPNVKHTIEVEATERPRFVAREHELSRLHGFLGQALAGHGRVAFVVGEAGRGKTALLQEFG